MPRDFSFQVFPAVCVLCGSAADNERDLCNTCAGQFTACQPACPRCALRLPSTSITACGQCLRQPPAQDAAHAALVYRWPIDALIHRYKFHRDMVSGRVLQEQFAVALMAHVESAVLLPVPLHPSRLRERGFNPALQLAQALAKASGAEVQDNSLVRVRNTLPQSGRTAIERRRNVRDAFAMSGIAPRVAAIIDDVVTTGSTTHEIAKLLRARGAERVLVFALARAV